MIQDPADFEAALEQLATWLQTPPAPGTQEEGAFALLLKEVEGYRPPMPESRDAPADSLSARAEALLSRAEHLRVEHDKRMERSHFMRGDGHGLGPTTGA